MDAHPTFLGVLFLFVSIFANIFANILQAVTSTHGIVGPQNYSHKSCDRVEIWHWDQFEPLLRGCTVIEGSLQIHILFDDIDLDAGYLSFPELREIAGFLMLFSTEGIISCSKLFPNLEVIRGQELVEKYALVISKMPDLTDLGLSSLRQITSGGVYIVGNSKLCFVQTIDWTLLLSGFISPSDIKIWKNSPDCVSSCPKSCPHCWNGNGTCQSLPSNCPQCQGRSCFGPGRRQCCHIQCAGSCEGPLISDCHACQNVGLVTSKEGQSQEDCLQICPAGLYEYLSRHCLTEEECLSKSVTAPSTHPTHPKEKLVPKLYLGKNARPLCVLTCPPGSYQDSATTCKPCENGRCQKVCPGGTVDSFTSLRSFSGCTILRNPGHLRIHIRSPGGSREDTDDTPGTTGSLVSLLKESLGAIEIIEDYLSVSHTYAVYSLDFLQNLVTIGGKVLSDNKHALVIKSNDNMMDLWSRRNVTISNPSARIMFHYNSKLCPDNIYKFLESSGVQKENSLNPMDIGITNGDKVTCNTKMLRVNLTGVDATFFTLSWENFAHNLTAPSYLLSYEVHYKETAPGRKETKLELRDPCGQDGWNILDFSPEKDEDEYEISRDEEAKIGNLLPFTDYAYYIKAVVLPSLYALNNNTGAESDILYAKTLPSTPQGPGELSLQSTQPFEIFARWTPPLRTNGPITHFKILLSYWAKSEDDTGSKDFGYCGDFEFQNSDTNHIPTSTKAPNLVETNATTPKPSHRKSSRTEENDANKLEESNMLNIILGEHLFTGVGLGPPFAPKSVNESEKARRKRSAPQLPAPRQNFDIYIPLQKTHVPASRLNHTFKALKPYTNYYVEVKTCRNDLCSASREQWVRTPSSGHADIVLSSTITSVMVNASSLMLTWAEPASPNGGIMSYFISLQRQSHPGSFSPGSSHLKGCLSRDSFLSQNNSYLFPEPLLIRGNYSLQIRSRSHSGFSTASTPIFILVPGSPSPFSGSLISWILIALLALGLLGSVQFYFLYKKNQSRLAMRIRTSANPGYVPAINIPREREIDPKFVSVDHKEDSVLGYGFYGTVYRGKLRKTDPKFVTTSKKKVEKVLCAVKEVNYETSSENKNDFLKEALLMVDLNSFHVVKLFGVVSTSQPFMLVMEYMPNKDLKSYLIRLRGSTPSRDDCHDPLLNPGPFTLTRALILSFAAAIADGMAYIHSRGLLHRDLAARNCLVDAELRVKIGDFGLSRRELTNYARLDCRPGRSLPVRWMSPESLSDHRFSKASDVWAFGVLLYEIVTLGGIPYPGINKPNDPNSTEPNKPLYNALMEFVYRDRGTLEMPPTSTELITEIAQDCWSYQPSERPTFFQILERLMPEAGTEAFKSVSFYHSKEGVKARQVADFEALQGPSSSGNTTIDTANLDID